MNTKTCVRCDNRNPVTGYCIKKSIRVEPDDATCACFKPAPGYAGDNDGPADMDPAPAQTKVCKKCGRELPLSEFGKHSKTADGYNSTCRSCIGESISRRLRSGSEDRPKPSPDAVGKDPIGGLELLSALTDDDIAAELGSRGWHGQLSKTLLMTI